MPVTTSGRSAATDHGRSGYPTFVWRLATVAWAVQIFLLSSSPKMTSEHTRSFLAILLEQWFGFRPAESSVLLFGLILRKGAHVTEYAILAFFVFRSLEGILAPSERLRRTSWCLALTAGYALSDEFHQWFVPGRGASLVDWGIDIAGVAITLLLLSVRRDFAETARQAH